MLALLVATNDAPYTVTCSSYYVVTMDMAWAFGCKCTASPMNRLFRVVLCVAILTSV